MWFLKSSSILITVIMSFVSIIVFIIILLVTRVKTEVQREPSMRSFKEYVSTIINNQSSKIQTLFEKIQTNAQAMLKKLDNVRDYGKKLYNRDIKKQDEAPDVKVKRLNAIRRREDLSKLLGRSYNGYTTTTGYGGPTGNTNNHMAPTYHHHSIGFDPVNIVISVSLLSFLLQTIQGLLSRITMPTTTVVEARNLDQTENWLNSYEKKLMLKPLKVDKYMKRKYQQIVNLRN